MKNNIIFLLLLVALSSCDKPFTVDNKDYQQKLVVNNLFQQNSPFEIVVSKSVNIYDNTLPEFLNSATVKLYVNNVLAETLTPFGSGHYNATTIPTAGNTYKVTVSNTGFNDVEAENFLPNPVKIVDWSYVDSTFINSDGNYFGDLSLTINDPVEENSYLLSFQFWDVGLNAYIFLRTVESSDESLNANLAKRLDNGEYLFNDNLFNGKRKTFVLNIPCGHYFGAPNYLLKLYSLTKDAYFYSFSKSGNSSGQNSSPIYTNVKNGLGIFAGRSLDVDTIR